MNQNKSSTERQEPINVEVRRRSKVQSKMRNRQSIKAESMAKSKKTGQSRESKHKQEEKGHNMNASRSTRLMTKIKTKEDRLSHYIYPIMQDQHFLHCQERGGDVKIN